MDTMRHNGYLTTERSRMSAVRYEVSFSYDGQVLSREIVGQEEGSTIDRVARVLVWDFLRWLNEESSTERPLTHDRDKG